MADTVLAEMAERAAVNRKAQATRARLKALRQVDHDAIVWRADIGPEGGFAGAGDDPITDPALLIALWELLREALICLRGNTVTLTRAGERELDASVGSVTRG